MNKETIMNGMELMAEQYVAEMNCMAKHDLLFCQRHLSRESADAMHKAIRAALDKENEGLTVKAEIFALLYICQPEALFRRKRLTRSVTNYSRRLMGLNTALLSAHKKNISFIYFKDKKFRAIAIRAVEAVGSIVEKENAQSN